MRLRDSFLALLAAASVVAAAIVVAALSGRNHDWDLLIPLMAFALAGSVATITVTLIAVLREPRVKPPATSGLASSTATTTDHLAGDAAPVKESPWSRRFWPVAAVIVVGVTLVVVVVARLLVGQSSLRPDHNVDLVLVTAWVVLAVALSALYLAAPPITRVAVARRAWTLAEIGIALAVASAAMLGYLRVRDRIGVPTLPDVVTAVIGVAAGAATFVALRRRLAAREAGTPERQDRSSPGGSPSRSAGRTTGRTTGRAAELALSSKDPASLLRPYQAGNDGTVSGWTRWVLSRWVGGLVAIAGLIPAFLAVSTLTLFFVAIALTSQNDLVRALIQTLTGTVGSHGTTDAELRVAINIVGPLVGIGAWVVAGLIAGRTARVDRANSEMYQRLCDRTRGLATVLGGVPPAPSAAPTTSVERAREDVRSKLVGLVDALNGDDTGDSSGLNWVTGSGYVSLWTKLHRAEEAELLFASLPDVMGAALEDAARLNKSALPNKDALNKRLADATEVIRRAITIGTVTGGQAAAMGGPAAAAAIQTTTTQTTTTQTTTTGTATTSSTPTTTQAPSATPPTDKEVLLARVDLREVRKAINEFKDSKSVQLVRVRRRLTESTVWAGVLAYLLTLLAIITGMPENLIAAASGLYLVAALAGLLQRIYREIDVKSGVEDYGVTTARLFLAPLVSGLAGIAGVAVIAILGTPTTLLPSGSAATASLADAFNLTKYPVALVLAAAFGLAPGALFNRLQMVSNQLKGDISSTSTTTGSTDTNTTSDDGTGAN